MIKHTFTAGVTLHVFASNYEEAERIVESLRDIDYGKLRVADWDMVEEYDPETGEVTTEWEEAE